MGRGYDSFHRRLYFFNYYISPPPPPSSVLKGVSTLSRISPSFFLVAGGRKKALESALWYLQGNFSLFSFPPPPRPHSLRAIRRLLTFEVRRNLGEFVNFSSFLSQIDSKGGGRRGRRGGKRRMLWKGRVGRKEGTKLINTIEEEYERREARAAQ